MKYYIIIYILTIQFCLSQEFKFYDLQGNEFNQPDDIINVFVLYDVLNCNDCYKKIDEALKGLKNENNICVSILINSNTNLITKRSLLKHLKSLIHADYYLFSNNEDKNSIFNTLETNFFPIVIIFKQNINLANSVILYSELFPKYKDEDKSNKNVLNEVLKKKINYVNSSQFHSPN
ncbi:hypothetical protein MASR1M45_01520 [Candidatus Kapaibacterium sp.]